jgi:hypothetical protein
VLATGCPTTPNKKPSISPSLAVNVWDYNCTSSPPCPPHPNNITGPRTYPPATGNPYQYGGLLDNRSETSFDTAIGGHAHDPIGLEELNITYIFNCEGDQGWEPLKSFDNTATQHGTNRFTVTSRILKGQPTTDLVFPSLEIVIVWTPAATVNSKGLSPTKLPSTEISAPVGVEVISSCALLELVCGDTVDDPAMMFAAGATGANFAASSGMFPFT